ncbi:MAG: hypothetical protein R3B06_02155 [Kofleriaceae bacterium]
MRTLLALATSLSLALGCSSARPSISPASAGGAPSTTPPRPGPDVDIAGLRREGPAALDRLLAAYDATAGAGARAALAATIDRVAGQRYATVSRLYWYTDLAAAQAQARATGKPILSLRLLGHLDEDLSCANSRMFRTILYPDPAVSQLLRDRFVLHWSSERPVPTVTIDYGDGRTLQTTVTGNSAHYVLDADGRPLDVLPGMYAPAVFAAELARAADQAARVATLDPPTWRRAMRSYHLQAQARAAAQWNTVRRYMTVDGTRAEGAALDAAIQQAMRATVSKAYVEVPIIATIDLGVDPGAAPVDDDARAEAAARLWKLAPETVLAAPARALVDALLPPGDHAKAITRLTRGLLAETVLDELGLRQRVRARLAADLATATPTFAALNAFVYAEVFSTPASDPWMGLRPTDTFTGLPGGAVVARR